jgi:hypothetical protein
MEWSPAGGWDTRSWSTTDRMQPIRGTGCRPDDEAGTPDRASPAPATGGRQGGVDRFLEFGARIGTPSVRGAMSDLATGRPLDPERRLPLWGLHAAPAGGGDVSESARQIQHSGHS